MSIPTPPPVAPLPPPGPLASEPVVTVGSVVAVGGAVVTTAVAFGMNLTPDQLKALAILGTTIAPFVVMIARRWSWSRRTVAELLGHDPQK